MKFHIVQIGEDIEKICGIYGIEVETLHKLNPSIEGRKLKVGEKIRVLERVEREDKVVQDINKIYTNPQKHELENKDEKYICPHCKNVILIPRNNYHY